MKKTAKQMFEELGWECLERKEDIYYKRKIEENNGWCRYCDITFNCRYKTIILEEYEHHSIWGCGDIKPEINYKELQAINKQVEELGWNK